MVKWVRGLVALGMACALVACGGGGGGGGGGGANDPQITLSPGSLAANVESGTSATLSVRATVGNPAALSGTLYIYIVDSRQVLTGTVNITPVDERSVSATVFTSPSLPVGTHTGTLQIQLCKDAQCAAQYAGSPIPLPYTITVAAGPLRAQAVNSMAATVHWGATLTQAVGVTVNSADLTWTASTTAPWLQISGGSGRGPGAFSVSYLTPTLAVGQYAATVTVRGSDGQTVDVPFSLEVIPTQFVLNSGVPVFSAVNGSPIAQRPLSFALDSNVSAPWNAVSAQPWLLLSPASGTTPALLSMQPDPSRGPLASGEHAADVTLSSPGIADRTVTARLTLLAPTLSATAGGVTLGGARGRDLTGSQALSISLNTAAVEHPWRLGTLPSWLASSTPSGTVSAIGSTLSFAPGTPPAGAGTSTATVTVSATVNGDTVSLPLTATLHVDQRRLLPSTWGVGLASTPLGTVVSRTLRVSDNFGGALGWTATSDSAWLGVTDSGNTGASPSLTLTADPTSLPAGAISVARVTIATATPGVESAVVRVALWKSASAPSAITTLPLDLREVVADRIRPLVYTHAGGSSIGIYNAYTAAAVGTIGGVGAALGKMSVSPDGSRLYALDTANRSLAVIDLDTRAVTATWTLDQAVDSSTSVLAIRPNGVEVVLVGHGRAYQEGRSLGANAVQGTLTASDDGRKVYAQDSGLSPASVYAYDVDYSAMAGGVLSVTPAGGGWFINGASNGQDIAVRGDGQALYTASGAPYRCSRVDPLDISFVGSLPGGDAYPNNVEVTSDGRALCGISGWYSVADFWVHASNGTELANYRVSGYAKALKTGQMVVTPDGMVVVVLTDDPVIGFVPIGPAP